MVDAELAARLLAAQFPQLERVEALGAGWDYSAFRVDDEYVFRFPRRAVVLPGMEREIATLPGSAARGGAGAALRRRRDASVSVALLWSALHRR